MAVTVTHNLRLNVPEFDQIPWDEDVNTNWYLLDATVGMFAAIPNLTGIWANSKAYTFGQSAIDATDSSIWQCVQSHTSSALPTSFALERVQYPARWTLTNPGAQFYATQAAQSAADAAASAAAAADSADAIAGGALLLAGGTMTGPLILYTDPVALLEAATKQYVDARVGGSGFLPLTGGTMTGALYVGGTGVGYMNIVAGDRHLISFGWNGTLYAAVNGTGVGAIATQAYVSGSYLPLSGGSLSGSLYSAGEMQSAVTFRITGTGAYFHSNASYTYLMMDSGGWHIRYDRATGTLHYYRSDGANLFQVDGNGNLYTTGSHSGTDMVASNNVYARGGTVLWGAGDRSRLSSNNATYTDMAMLDAYRWSLAWSTGNLTWYRYDSTALFAIDVSGSVACIGNLTANGNLYVSNSNTVIGTGGSGRIMQFQPNFYWDFSTGSGTLQWITSGSAFLMMDNSAGWTNNYRGPFAGNGAYVNISDERVKTDIEPATLGLDAIRKLKPINFKRHGERIEIGFSAQQVRDVVPEAVFLVAKGPLDDDVERDEHNSLLGVAIEPVVAALVNAVQELADRMEAGSGTTTH